MGQKKKGISMATVADVLKRIERIQKDLEYVRTFQEKWREQRARFPQIYEGIVAQERAFLRRIDELRQLKVEPHDEADAAIGDEEPAPSLVKPHISPGASESSSEADSSDEKRNAAAAGIDEKLRKRSSDDARVLREAAK